ncbi:molecular chaperone DnaJ [Microbulbifer sp. YPW1]|uniref:molecular chaperone DnaJ n=1 Tax=Microbulbifer sp. YPW1 TaxID=2745199 RepID=UPI00159B55DE|nr:molecular chaperone DnaJ [Microbulbifer sp. YPW1]QKX16504.1 molecular chaperone DnaJ [Microbulbifer sp. YPW1]
MRKILVLFAIISVSVTAVASESSAIGFKTVSEALNSLRQDPQASESTQNGWAIFATKKNGNYVLWSFSPPEHEAYPAAVKRTVLEREGSISIDIKALCQAEKVACDNLIEEFKQLNERIAQQMQGGGA